jgi:hypothetical protein
MTRTHALMGAAGGGSAPGRADDPDGTYFIDC